MQFGSVSAISFAALIVGALLCPSPASSAKPLSIQDNIDIAISSGKSVEARVESAKAVTEGWKDSLPVLIQNIDSYYQSDEGKAYSDDAVAKLVPLTDLLVTIVINKDGSVQKFRESDTEKTIDLLAAAAGGNDRDLRFNASYILAKAVDDGNLCVILHRLREPELGYAGQVNLLQIAISGTSTASREIVQAAKQIADRLKTSTKGKTAALVNMLDQIASARKDAAEPLPTESYCARYNVETGIANAISSPSTPATPPP